MIRFFLASILLVAATVCPEQKYHDYTKSPAVVDPNRIALDPASGQRLCLGQVIATQGRSWTVAGAVCDPDGDRMTLTASVGELQRWDDGAYKVTGPADALGVLYVTLTCTDEPPDATQALTRAGTWIVIVVPPNRAPVLCGGLP